MIISKKTLYLFILLIAFLGLLACIYKKDSILLNIGEFLFVESNPEKADMIVVLRGGTNYARVLEASHLFKNGYAHWIYISKSLSDQNSKVLKKYGVELPSGQERLRSILIQLGIPEEKILLGQRAPGGGTRGEAMRIKSLMRERSFNKAIVITNWWHTRRVNKIFQKVLGGTGIKVFVLAGKNDKSNPSNWWKHRYETVSVLQEFPKLCFFYLNSIFDISFSDDPKEELLIQLQ